MNNSEETLPLVTTDLGGFMTLDMDDPNGVMTVSEKSRTYRDVEPQEAVLIMSYDKMYDSDYVFQIGVSVVSPSLGKKSFSKSFKGGKYSSVLMYRE